MDIKILNLEDFDINDYDTNDTIDVNLDKESNVFFSYPYFSYNDIDYQFRFTFDEQQVTIDEIKTDNKLDFDNVILTKTISNLRLEKFDNYLSKLIDFRDGQTILEDGVINFNLDGLDNDKIAETINNNKKYVLYEIYNIFLE
jgi:hypothetical protein